MAMAMAMARDRCRECEFGASRFDGCKGFLAFCLGSGDPSRLSLAGRRTQPSLRANSTCSTFYVHSEAERAQSVDGVGFGESDGLWICRPWWPRAERSVTPL